MKTCTKCGETKPLEEFPNDKNRKDGKFPWCKACNARNVAKWRETPKGKTLARKWRVEHPDYWTDWNQTEAGQRCRENGRRKRVRHQVEYQRTPAGREVHRKANDKYRERHKEEINTRSRESAKRLRLADPEKYRLRGRVQAAHRRSKRIGKPGRYKPEVIEAMMVSQNRRCWWCGEPLDAYHIDHRVPLSRGGSNEPENLCLTCPSCNLKKGGKMPGEFNGRLL